MSARSAVFMPDSLTVPPNITFEQAIELAQSLLFEIEQGQLSEAEIEEVVRHLVQTENGARGFFVTYLSSEESPADQPSPGVVLALQASPGTVAGLLARNLAMSAAMELAHRSNQNEAMAQGSHRVKSRTAHLVQLVQLAEVNQEVQKLADSAATGSGDYQAFLDRWGYDANQRQAIQRAAQAVLQHSS